MGNLQVKMCPPPLQDVVKPIALCSEQVASENGIYLQCLSWACLCITYVCYWIVMQCLSPCILQLDH